VAKVYSEKEAAEILQRAVALQESNPEGAIQPYTPGITDEELRRIAQESGLDLRYLEMAIAAGPPPPPKKKFFLDLVQEHERVIDGELPPDKFDVVLEEVGTSSSGRSMGLRQVGRVIEGQFSKGFGFGFLRVSSRNGRTRLNVRSSSFLPFMSIMYPCSLGGIMSGAGVLAHGNLALGLSLMIGLPFLGFLGARIGQKKGHADVTKLVNQLEARISEETVHTEPAVEVVEKPAEQNIVE
jgi:hypothetical protein